MKYLKTFESKDIDKTYIEDLFGDLKDICNFSSWNGEYKIARNAYF